MRIGARQFVRSVPTELSTDSNEVIEMAQVRVWCVRVRVRVTVVIVRGLAREEGGSSTG